MSSKFNFFLLFILCSTSLIAQQDNYTQLCILNKEWLAVEPTAELLEHRQFTSEQEIITYHLQQVEKYLTKKNITHLPKEVQQRRTEGLAVLNEYWKRALYPKNNRFNYRIPFFIDDANTACAVGYIMQGTGYQALAENISDAQNNAYVKEMVGDNIFEWATNYGFTVDELAWIQPTYEPCMGARVSLENEVKPTCGNNNGIIEIEDYGIVSYQWEHGATGLQLNNLPAGIYTITGTHEITENGENCPFRLDIVLENENSADLEVNILKRQSCVEVADGVAEVIVSNANGNYNIEWSNGATTAVASNLTTGKYIVTVTDDMNCKAIAQANLYGNFPITANEVVLGSACNSNTGSINLNINGGSDSGTYTALWMDGNTMQNRANLPGGIYTVTISDDAGCTTEKNIMVNDDCNGKINCEDDYLEVNNEHAAYMFVFSNDIDPLNGEIISIQVSLPLNGTVLAYTNQLYDKKLENANNTYLYYTGNDTYTGPDSFTYTVCTNSGFCDDATVYLNVVSAPVVTLRDTGADTLQIYLGETEFLTTRGAESYSWFPTEYLDYTAFDDVVSVSPIETITYTITGTNAGGQTDTRDITIEVIEAGFKAFNNAIQINQDSDNGEVYVNGALQMVNITVLDANNNVVMQPSIEDNAVIIQLYSLADGLHYLNIQHKDYPDVRTNTILKK